jgi:hypothetical protein
MSQFPPRSQARPWAEGLEQSAQKHMTNDRNMATTHTRLFGENWF